ncbi:MAG: hypothetical protein QOD75_123 [Blastocatellia bacterium]|nr:hypothetical protein [Blastocatellia bacterium]
MIEPDQYKQEADQPAQPRSEPSAGYGTAVKAGGTVTDVIGRLLWIGVLAGAALGLLNFVTTYYAHADMSAPQMAALAAQCLAIAVLPYVLARAWDEVCRPPRWR